MNEMIKKAFVKDFNLPISIFEDNHFQYTLDILNPYYNSLSKYKLLEFYIEKLKETSHHYEEAFHVFNKKVIDNAIDSIKNNEAYKNFISMDMSKYQHNLNIAKSNQLYKSQNHGKRFVSIDLVKANFQSLKFVNPDIVLGFDSYNQFLNKFTNFNYHLQSKKMRQVIFGNLNPKRQQTVQKYIMSQLTKQLIELGLEKNDILNCTSDELIFEYKEEHDNIISQLIQKDILSNIDFHIEVFDLYKFDIDKPFYYKKDLNNNITLKGIPNHSVLECIKNLENKEINEMDLQFMFEGRKCQFSESIFKE